MSALCTYVHVFLHPSDNAAARGIDANYCTHISTTLKQRGGGGGGFSGKSSMHTNTRTTKLVQPEKGRAERSITGMRFCCVFPGQPPLSSPTTHSGAENFPFFLPRLQQALAGLSLRTQTQFRFGKSIVFFFCVCKGCL